MSNGQIVGFKREDVVINPIGKYKKRNKQCSTIIQTRLKYYIGKQICKKHNFSVTQPHNQLTYYVWQIIHNSLTTI